MAGEEPNLDRLLVPNVCINTSAVHVESMSVGAVVVIRDKGTSGIVTVNGLALFTYDTSDGGSESGGKLASGTGVSSDLVESVFVDTLDDIDFTVVGPVVTDGPVCGPCATAVGHRPHVGDEKTAGIVFLLRVDVDSRGNAGVSFDVLYQLDMMSAIVCGF